jgi:transcriptional regulator with XRE-family HTH domain
MARSQPFSASTRDVGRLLGQQVRLGRLQRRWTVSDLASRVGVSEVTMAKVERGDLSVALGTALEAAGLVGVALYEGPQRRAVEARRVSDVLALLPAAARPRRSVDDDF